MSLDIVALVLLAAVLHAGWNALVKVSGDRFVVVAFMAFVGCVVSLFCLPFVETPDPASWPFLALTILLHTGYHFFLSIAYDNGDLGQVYPIARGSAPILVTLGAIVFAGEVLDPIPMIGVVCLAVGVMALAFDKGNGLTAPPKAVMFALATALFIASYTVVDGLGARQAGSVLGYAVWLTIGDGLLTMFIALIWKRGAVSRTVRANLASGCLGGVMQIGAYWIVIWALAIAPMGMVSALRETSVLFAALISTFLLKEGFGVWRFVSASLVTFGLILTRSQK